MATTGVTYHGVTSMAAVDGRSAIRDRNRNAVLDAVLDLFSEGNLSPGPDEVAVRAGLLLDGPDARDDVDYLLGVAELIQMGRPAEPWVA